MLSAATGLRRTPRVLFAWIALPVLVVGGVLLWPLLETCENSRLRDIESPGRDYRLIVFERSCSGTVAWTTHVSIVRTLDTLPNEPGNVLVSVERHGSLVGQKVNDPEVHARWVGNNQVELSYPSGLLLQLRTAKVFGIEVVLKKLP